MRDSLKAHERTEVWLKLENHDKPMDEARKDLIALGNQIIKEDEENRMFLVVEQEQEIEWPL